MYISSSNITDISKSVYILMSRNFIYLYSASEYMKKKSLSIN